MIITLPYGTGEIKMEMDDERVAGIVTASNVRVGSEKQTIKEETLLYII